MNRTLYIIALGLYLLYSWLILLVGLFSSGFDGVTVNDLFSYLLFIGVEVVLTGWVFYRFYLARKYKTHYFPRDFAKVLPWYSKAGLILLWLMAILYVTVFLTMFIPIIGWIAVTGIMIAEQLSWFIAPAFILVEVGVYRAHISTETSKYSDTATPK